MIKREMIKRLLEAQKEQMEAERAPLKEKLADLRTAIVNLLKTTPEDLWSIEELGAALKPSQIVCLTGKKFMPEETGESHCEHCEKHCHEGEDECAGACQCDETPVLCETCLGFLFQVINFMGAEKEIDVFGFMDDIYVGVHLQ